MLESLKLHYVLGFDAEVEEGDLTDNENDKTDTLDDKIVSAGDKTDNEDDKTNYETGTEVIDEDTEGDRTCSHSNKLKYL